MILDFKLDIYFKIQKELINLFNYYKNNEYKKVKSQESFYVYSNLTNDKRHIIDVLIIELKKALKIKQITDYF